MSQIDKSLQRKQERTIFRIISQDNLCDDVKRSFTSFKQNIRRIFFESIAGLGNNELTCAEQCERDEYLNQP
jgi:hypothetical protein